MDERPLPHPSGTPAIQRVNLTALVQAIRERHPDARGASLALVWGRLSGPEDIWYWRASAILPRRNRRHQRHSGSVELSAHGDTPEEASLQLARTVAFHETGEV
jgi:hypothetical protein